MRKITDIGPFILMTLIILSGVSCDTYKYVPKGDKLYVKTRIDVSPGKEEKSVLDDLRKLTKPRPNTSMLGVRYRLILYNMFEQPKKPKGWIYTIKNKWGEAPALLSSADPLVSAKRMEDYYFGLGHFHPVITYQVHDSGENASITYHIDKHQRYLIGDVHLPADSSLLSSVIRESFDSTLLEKGSPFSLQRLSTERERVDGYLKKRGYFFFNPEFILFKVDSTHQGVADIYLTVQEETPELAKKTWTIGDIRVYGNYQVDRDSLIVGEQGRRNKRFYYIDQDETYKVGVFEKAVTLREGQLYNRDNHSLTIERLMNLNNFRFVKLQFDPWEDSGRSLLHTSIFVMPSKKRSLRFEVSGNSKSNNFFGSELGLTYKNINLFRGAEVLEIKLNGGMDLQAGGFTASNAYTLNASANLYLPKIYNPFFRVRTNKSAYLPRTFITPGIEYNRTPELYTLRSIQGAFGYYWKYGQSTEHTFRLINVSLIQPSQTTAKFDSILAGDPGLRASTEKQLIMGMRYEYNYNNTWKTNRRFNYAFYGYASTSGNLTNLLIRSKGDTVGSKQIGGVPVSQYLKVQGDVRGYYHISPRTMIAGRFLVGASKAYGNSSAVPYFEQFITGGSSSIRAFRLRTLGPGSFHTMNNGYNAVESGEFKLEMNAELRVKMGRYFGFAAFLDAGNVWNWKDSKDKPGSGLDKGDLFGEMAVGTGMGVRFDISIMVIRLDIGVPLRKPWYPTGQRWVFNQIDLGDPTWRKENLILNIAIGYPF